MGNWEEAVADIDQRLAAIRRTTEGQRTVQQVNGNSAQPCGCDSGANWVCQACRDRKAVTAWTTGVIDVLTGIGGAPTRATTLPKTAAERKRFPIASGFMDYFPDAIAAIANLSYVGNEQHNPGQPLHWDRSKSADEADTCQRHFLERGTRDTDGVRHTVKFAWRALAILQKELEQEKA